jgi:nitrile hydratase
MPDFDARKVAQIHQHLRSHLPSEPALRVKALETLLVDKGLVNTQTIDAWVEAYTEEIGPKRGARIVAKAWCDPEFKTRLMGDAPAAIDELGYLGKATAHLKVVENTAEVHNLVVCTLCSCYPFSILGIAPAWYKAAAYRSRAVRDPRGVLAEFAVVIDDDVEVRVWDSTAELRYMVLPQRPVGTEDMGEEELAGLVTRNSMIGTDRILGASARGSS